jgi:hypothetical protein
MRRIALELARGSAGVATPRPGMSRKLPLAAMRHAASDLEGGQLDYAELLR